MAERPEPVGERRADPAERHQVREQEVLDPVEDLAVAQGLEVERGGRPEQLPQAPGQAVAGQLAVGDDDGTAVGRAQPRLLEELVGDLLLADVVAHVVAGDGRREQEAAEVRLAGPGVVLAVGVAVEGHRLRVRADHVVALDEGLDAGLPVAVDLPAHPQHGRPVLERPPPVVVGQPAEVLRQRGRLRVEVHEHEAAPGVDADLGQRHVAPVELGEVPPRRDVLEGAVEVPRPGVERAAQLAVAAGLRAQLGPAVQAGVGVRLEGARVGAYHDHRVVADLVDHGVADSGDLVLVAGHLPDPRPQALHLEVVERSAHVALPGHRTVAERLVARVPAHDVGHRVRVAVEVVLHGPARAPAPSPDIGLRLPVLQQHRRPPRQPTLRCV